MKTIKLTQGYVAIVDDDDFEWLNQYKWHAHRRRNNIYAYGVVNGQTIRMHRLILDIIDKSKIKVDHINSDGLDNRRCNLRTASQAQNGWNRRKHCIYKNKRTSSKYKGVSRAERKLWMARATINYKCIYIGHFRTEIEAAKAYNRFARNHYGEFARLNELRSK